MLQDIKVTREKRGARSNKGIFWASRVLLIEDVPIIGASRPKRINHPVELLLIQLVLVAVLQFLLCRVGEPGLRKGIVPIHLPT